MRSDFREVFLVVFLFVLVVWLMEEMLRVPKTEVTASLIKITVISVFGSLTIFLLLKPGENQAPQPIKLLVERSSGPSLSGSESASKSSVFDTGRPKPEDKNNEKQTEPREGIPLKKQRGIQTSTLKIRISPSKRL